MAYTNLQIGSPPARRRGPPYWRERRGLTQRLTPASAGTTRTPSSSGTSKTAHPRGGGDHSCRLCRCSASSGSPPRRRGPRRAGAVVGRDDRFTPASAGTTRCPTRRRRSPTVHPRIGGDHDEKSLRGALLLGSPPRRRGPRDPLDLAVRVVRLTPASAGTTSPLSPVAHWWPVRARVGGNHALWRMVPTSSRRTPWRLRNLQVRLLANELGNRNTLSSAETTPESP